MRIHFIAGVEGYTRKCMSDEPKSGIAFQNLNQDINILFVRSLPP